MKIKKLKELRLTKNIIIPFPNFQQNTIISPTQMNDNFEEIEYAYNNLIDNHNGAIQKLEDAWDELEEDSESFKQEVVDMIGVLEGDNSKIVEDINSLKTKNEEVDKNISNLAEKVSVLEDGQISFDYDGSLEEFTIKSSNMVYDSVNENYIIT